MPRASQRGRLLLLSHSCTSSPATEDDGKEDDHKDDASNADAARRGGLFPVLIGGEFSFQQGDQYIGGRIDPPKYSPFLKLGMISFSTIRLAMASGTYSSSPYPVEINTSRSCISTRISNAVVLAFLSHTPCFTDHGSQHGYRVPVVVIRVTTKIWVEFRYSNSFSF